MVGCVAKCAVQIASTEADEHACSAGVIALALKRTEYFVNGIQTYVLNNEEQVKSNLESVTRL
jgi:hypothetical protein